MPKIKEVPSTEVHWQVANWNVRDAANARIKQMMGADAQYFAPVYVTHGSYYWSDADVEGWLPLSSVSEADQVEARNLIAAIKSRTLKRLPGRASIIDQVFTFPNDDFTFVRRRSGDHLELRLTGWGFANYNRARGTVISETINEDKINEISVSFSIDGEAVPHREFSFARGMEWASAETDDDGNYNFGRHMPGSQVSVRDTRTGIERIITIEPTTTHIDVDVTEYLTLRIIGRHDGQPLDGDIVDIAYGRRNSQLKLEQGVAGCSLPWFEGVECEVSCRGSVQRRELRKDILNEFVFESETPRTPRTTVEVRLTDNGAPISGERVALSTPVGVVNLMTDADGRAVYEFDLGQGGDITANVRDASETKKAIDGTVLFEMAFDTPPVVEFDAYLRTVNNEGEALAYYPVNINIGDGSQTVECLTDENGLVGPIRVLSGNTMTAYDGNRTSNYETFLLDANRQEYVFVLPYDNLPNMGDISLRVIQRNGAPAAGATCILSQDTKRVTARLGMNGDMFFGSDDFDPSRPVIVNLYSPHRSFPVINLDLVPGETQYELVEVDGPQPWWKIAGEIALAGASVLALVGLYFGLEAIYSRIPNLFA